MSRLAVARGGLKGAVEVLLFRAGPARIGREMLRGRIIVLAYHNVVPEGAPVLGDRPLHLPLRSFEAQLDLLRETHDVVPLEDVLNVPVEPDDEDRRPRAVITFDDAYRGAVTAGVAALTARGLPATIFVAPHFVDGGTFWWDCVPPLVMTERFRERALNEMGGRDHEVRRWMNANGSIPTPVPDHQTCASMEELAQTAARPGITLASHSWSHPNLTRLPSGELEEELRKPLAWLRENFRNTIPWISYPYGISSEGVEEAARANGYRGALRAGGGWLPASLENRYALPRQNVSSALSIEGFGARSAGLLCR